MPFLRLNKGSRQFGVQTYAKARALMPELRDVELEYLSVRDWYVERLNELAQFDEHLEQAKRSGAREEVSDLGQRIHGIQGQLVDARARVRSAGERSWAEAFYLAADCMLSKETLKAIGIEADRLIGRQRHELEGKK